MIANGITISRILFSFLLLGFPMSSCTFTVLYLLCGVSDVLDGFFARKLHTESKTGEWLDSIADIVFAVIYVIKIVPSLQLPVWIWIWTGSIAIVKIVGIIKKSKKKQRFYIAHSYANKLTGLLIFLLPLTIRFFDIKYCAVIVCAVATFAAAEEIFRL